jgi:hypothetical protein
MHFDSSDQPRGFAEDASTHGNDGVVTGALRMSE